MIEEIYLIDYRNRGEGFKGESLPVDTIVVFVDGSGDKIEVSKAETGLSVRITRRRGFDQLVLEPRSSNQVIIK